MNRKAMVACLKGIVVILVVLCALFFFGLLPMEGRALMEMEKDLAWAFWPCLIWAWLFAVPVFFAAVPAWQIFDTLKEKGKAFCRENSRRFRLIAFCSWASAFIFLAGLIIMGANGVGSGPLWFAVAPMLLLGLCAFGFACYAMSGLVKESAEMKEENELTV